MLVPVKGMTLGRVREVMSEANKKRKEKKMKNMIMKRQNLITTNDVVKKTKA